uniref:Uncharacterized protein n=1 Tax=Oryza meridionalis TaxID=40149 RepID=A0A0E0D1R6_9ORYZ
MAMVEQPRKMNLEYYALLTAKSRVSACRQQRRVGNTNLMASSVSCFRGMVLPTVSSSHGGRGQLGRSEVIGNWKDEAQCMLLGLLLLYALSIVMKGQRDGEPSCSSPECVQASDPVPRIMLGTYEYHD